MNDKQHIIHGKFQSILSLAMKLDQMPKKFGTDKDLSHSEIHLIEIIGDNQNQSVTDLAGLLGITKGAVSQSLKRLEKKGFTRKSPDPANLSRILKALTDELVERQNSYLMVIPRSDPEYAAMESELLRDQGFEALYQPPAPERYFVDVGMPADEAMASLSQKWRYNLRKSQKQDLRFEWHHGSAGAALFQPVFHQMMSRKNFYDESPIDSLEQIAESRIRALRPEFAIVFEKDEPVAAAAIDMSGERSIYLYGATNKRGNKLRAGYFMQWEIMKRLCKTSRIRWYDLGGATSETCSLHQFKRGLTGKAGVVSDIPPYFGKGSDLLQVTFGKAALKSRLLKFQLHKQLHKLAPAFMK